MSTVEWQPVQSVADIERLMSCFGGFHDSCLREAHLWTGYFVDHDLTMVCPGSLDVGLRMLFQRQFREPSAIEMLFEEVTAFYLAPSSENYDAIIFEATLQLRPNGTFYWSDTPGGVEHAIDRTWVAARRLSWRDATEWMGAQLRYGPRGQ